MNAYRTFDARVRAAARAATPIDRLLLLAEGLALAVLSPGRGRFPKGKLTADERRAFGVEKLLDSALGRLGLTRALFFLGAGSDPEAPGVFFLPVAARWIETPATAARVPQEDPDERLALVGALGYGQEPAGELAVDPGVEGAEAERAHHLRGVLPPRRIAFPGVLAENLRVDADPEGDEPHDGTVLVSPVGDGEGRIARCLACGTVGPVRETSEEAKRALEDLARGGRE